MGPAVIVNLLFIVAGITLNHSSYAEILGQTEQINKEIRPENLPNPNLKECKRKRLKKGEYLTGDVSKFVRTCLEKGVLQRFCLNMTRPNRIAESVEAFKCTYPGKPHALIPPDESEWEFGIKAALILQKVSRENKICVEEIYNWYRPEPYNSNVKGRPGRHPNATAIDVKFCTPKDAKAAFKALCEMYREKEIWALGTYPAGIEIHIGVMPEQNATWGPYACRN